MSEIDLGYRQLLRERERKRLDDFMNQPDENEAATVDEPFPETSGVPATPKPRMQGPRAGEKAAAQAVGAQLKSAWGHFTSGVWRTAQSSMDPNNSGTESLNGFGEILLGGMEVMMALPAGVGAYVRAAIKDFVPGLENTTALSPDASAALRVTFGLPGVVLDPETRQALAGDPKKTPEERMAIRQAMWDELKKPMTYGELMEFAAMFAVPGVISKGLKTKARTGPMPEPLRVQEATGVPQAPRVEPSLAPEIAAERLSKAAETLEPQMVETPGAQPRPGARVETPGGPTPRPDATIETPPARGAVREADVRPGAPEGQLPEALDVAEGRAPTLARAMDVAGKRADEIFRAEKDPKLQEFMKEIEELQKRPAPTVEEAAGEKPAPKGKGGKTPEELAKEAPGPKTPPDELIAEVEKEMKGRPAEEIEAEINKRMKVEGKPEARAGEAGKIETSLLARMAVGAVIGGTQGDTPEERVAFMLLGMGLGTVASRRVAKAFIARIKGDPATEPILDPSLPKTPGFRQIDLTPSVERIINEVAPGDKASIGRVLGATPEEVLSREDLITAKKAEQATWKRVQELSSDIRSGQIVKPGDLKAALALARTLRDNVEATGRRIGATGVKGLERTKVAKEKIMELAREWDPSTSEQTLAAAISDLRTLEEVGLFARLYYAVPEALTEAMYGTMLFGKAVVKNAVGNVPMIPISIVDRSIAQLFRTGPRAAWTDAQMGTVAFWEAVQEQFRLVRSWEALGEQARAVGSTHAEVMPRGFEALADISRQFGPESQFTEHFARGLERLHSLANIGPGVLQRTDGMAKAMHGRIGIQWEAIQKAQREGLSITDGDSFWTRVGELVNDYSLLDADQLVRVKRHRDRMTFTQEFEGSFMQALQAGPEDPWLNFFYRMTFAPFVRTPVRLMEVGAEYTPGLNLAAKAFRDDYRAGGLDRSIAMSKLATGTLVLGSFGWLSAQGLITGNLPTFKEGGVAVEHAGRPAQSFWDPLAKKFRSFKGMEPLTQWISTAADVSYLVGQLPEKDAMRLITAYTVAVSNNLNITAFMQSVSEFLDVAKNGRTDSQWEKSLEFIRRRLTVFIPAAVKEATKGDLERVVLTGAFDEDKSPSAAMHRELRALIDEYQRGFGVSPGEPGKPPFLKVKRNMFTGDVLRDDTWPFNPFTTRPAQLDPWAAEIRRMNGAGLKPVPDWLGHEDAADIGMQERPTSPGVRLIPQEIDRWEVLMTKEVTSNGKKLTDSLNELVTSERYQRFGDVTRKDLIQERYNWFKNAAKAKLLMENESLRRALRDKKVESQIERLPKDMQPGAKQRFGIGVQP